MSEYLNLERKSGKLTRNRGYAQDTSDGPSRDHKGLTIHYDTEHETTHYKMDVYIEHLNLMRIWCPINSHKGLPTLCLEYSRQKSILKGYQINQWGTQPQLDVSYSLE